MNTILKKKLSKEILILRNRLEKLSKEREKSHTRTTLIHNKINMIKKKYKEVSNKHGI